MPVTVRCTVRRIPLRRTEIERLAQRILGATGEPLADVSLSFIGDASMRRLNRQYRRKDAPTDVLAFPMRHIRTRVTSHASRFTSSMLGDVVISVPQAARQACERGLPLHHELATLLIHGILHLLGYDHERNLREAQRMQRKEQAVLRAIGPLLALVTRKG
ncbi:MAG: rRNA maturation RNase YbeY [Nitrospira sp.]|nr:rRNA maturation RNase YbeY [Nitrospira sp.]